MRSRSQQTMKTIDHCERQQNTINGRYSRCQFMSKNFVHPETNVVGNENEAEWVAKFCWHHTLCCYENQHLWNVGNAEK